MVLEKNVGSVSEDAGTLGLLPKSRYKNFMLIERFDFKHSIVPQKVVRTIGYALNGGRSGK